ncbi:arylacetamide deacetylase-like [Mizuhopecten yessoensis]|uniref:Arylacetamide deacetylase n=1 Tax=Mizuhopecten yessoensis TaxID=6573 RepID=A0A210R707_MIZYE|nr:arylacetamide deacetylase-like [Mizuhopecten yessoensis]XP_021375043.1 arylacetamide deacetylase-like [Mizuhopecten yessoensis]OWF56718.1 Arylacetamide deacetylase [Mizuhopecten yessoensis]
MQLQTCLIVSAALLVGVAYYVYYPFPADADQPWKQMMSMVPIRTINHVCHFGERVGYSSSALCRRWFSLFLMSKQELSDEDLEVTDTLFGGVKVRLYIPKESNPEHTGLVYIHGGGWYLGNVNIYDKKTRDFARSLKAVVVSIDYRLAPEHPFPVPLEDCLAATKHFLGNAKKYGVNPRRIGIGGDSAGGNLAMAVALKLAKEGETGEPTLPPLRSLSLVYPALQIVDFNLPSYVDYTGGPFLLNKQLMVSAWLTYAFGNENHLTDFFNNRHMSPESRLNLRRFVNSSLLPGEYIDRKVKDSSSFNKHLAEEVGDTLSNQFLSPLLSSDEDLRKLPKMLLFTCQYDPLLSDGIILVKRLQNLGNPVVYQHFTGVQHGFFSSRFVMTKGKQALTAYKEFLKKEL